MAGFSFRSLPVRWRLLDCWCDWTRTVMIFIWWTADDVAKEAQSSVGYGVRESRGWFHTGTFNCRPSKLSKGYCFFFQRCVGLQYWSYGGYTCGKVCGWPSQWPTCQTHQCNRKGRPILRCGPRFTPVQQGWNYVRLIKTQLGIQPDAIDFHILLFQKVHATPCQSYPTQDLSSAANSRIDRAAEIDEGVDHFNMSICHLDCWTCGWIAELDNLGFRPVDVNPKATASSSITDSARTSILLAFLQEGQ